MNHPCLFLLQYQSNCAFLNSVLENTKIQIEAEIQGNFQAAVCSILEIHFLLNRVLEK